MSDRDTPTLISHAHSTNGERSPKRQRLDNGYASARYGSPDELADSPLPSSTTTSKPRPLNQRTGRPHSSNGTQRHSIDDPQTLEDSPDELDHLDRTFFARDRRNSHIQPSTPYSENAESEDGFPTSSPVQSLDEREVHARLRYMPKLILRGHKRGVGAVKFSPDGKWIASCSADATCKIWDAQTGKHQYTLEGHLAGISTIAWSPDSKVLASGSDDHNIRLWDITTGRAHPEPFRGHHNYIYSIAFSPKGNMLVSGSYDEAVFLWDVRTGRVMRSLPAHSDPVGGVDFVRDGTLIVSCSSDGLIRVWDTGTGQCLRTFFHEDTPPVMSVKFTPNGKYIIAWMLDSSLRMWDYVEGKCVKTYQGHVNTKYSLGGAIATYGEDSSALVVSGSEDGSIFFWDVNSKAVLQKLEGHVGTVLGVDTHPTEKMIVSCGMDKTIRIWREDDQDAQMTG